MSLVRLDNVFKAFAGQPVLEGVSLRIEEGEKVGLIGRNGTGKSTIFRLILGEQEPDKGTIERMRRARMASLAQMHNVDPEHTVFDIVLHSFGDLLELEHELAVLEQRMGEGDEAALDVYGDKQEQFTVRGGYDFRTRIKQVLQGLGFLPEEFNLRFRALSGGQRTRLMLALVLLQDADLLLLDEPENHLDLEAREWLEEYLTTCKAAVLVISHDRRTLNAVAKRILDMERGELRSYTGNYDSAMEQKELWIEQQQAAYERQQDYIRKEMVWVNRFKAKATKARAAQSKLKALDKIERLEAPPDEKAPANFNLGEIVRSGALALDARSLTMGYGNLTLYKDVSFQVQRGERIGILGPNGAGKTTLLRQIAGKHDGLGGDVVLGHKVSIGYYDQNHETMNPLNNIVQEVHQVRSDWTATQIRTFMGKMLFVGEDTLKQIKTLSGGELSRVAMAKLILGNHNLLMLDEPTNHLDIVSREALEAALSEYPGGIVMISHDRALIDRLVDKLVILENGTTEVFDGNYTEYREEKLAAAAAAGDEPKRAQDVLKIRREQKEEKPKAEKAKPAEKPKQDRKQQRKIEDLEADIAKAEAEIKDLERRLIECEPSDYGKIQQLHGDYEKSEAKLKQLYASWEKLNSA